MSKYLATIVDSSEQPNGEGYVATRHTFYPNVILVFAPCGCRWISDKEDRFVTPCGKDNCVFEWAGIQEAVAALQAAETSVEVKGIVVKGDEGGLLPVQCNDSPPVDLLPTGGGVSGDEKASEEAAGEMISEGGPVETT